MAEPRKDYRIDELEIIIADKEKENEELKKKVEELENEKSMYESEITALKLNYEDLADTMNDLQIRSTQCENEISRMWDMEQLKDRMFEEIIDVLINRITLLRQENEAYEKYIQELLLQNEKYKNMMMDICLKPSNLGKIPIYVIRRKHKYPYFVKTSRNYQEALEEFKRFFPNFKVVYKVNYDHEETYSRYLQERELKDIDILGDDILLKKYTEKEFVEDLKNIFVNDQTGCHTFSLIKKEEFSYYASRVQKERLQKTKKVTENKFPSSEEICTLSNLPNAIMLHNRIKEKFPGHVSGNHIKLPATYTEEKFIREVKRMAEPTLSP